MIARRGFFLKHTLRLGLALGGGGARGFAHLGVLIALEENQIPVSVITGTSIGAVIGAAKALEMDLKKLERLLSCLDLNELLQVSSSTTREIQRVIGRGMVEYVRGTSLREEKTTPERLARIRELFSLLTANKSFSDITIPFAAVAADLETGQRVVLNQGKLGQAAAASAAIPGVFHPVRYRKRFLIDGGVIDKIPASLAIEMGAESVLAIDTGAPLASSINTSFDIFLQTYGITSRELTSLQLDAVRKQVNGRFLLLKPDVSWIKLLDFEQSSAAIQAGKEEAIAHMSEIKELCGARGRFSGVN